MSRCQNCTAPQRGLRSRSMPRKRRWPKPPQLWQLRRTTSETCLLDRRRALAAREEEHDFYEETDCDMETVGQWWHADMLGNSWQESWGQSYWRPHAAIVGDRHVEIGDCRGTTYPACLRTVNHGRKCEVPANCCWHVGQALGRSPASSFHSCGYGRAIHTKPHSQSARRRRRADSATARLTGSTAASPATVGDLRLALGMKHPHDVTDQMDLDLAMSGVFRAVPLLPDSERLGRIQVYTDGSAMLERAWPCRRRSAAWRAVLVQTNSQGLDALIGFLGDTVQTHQPHPPYLGAPVKTISTAELSAIITTLATVICACSKLRELNFLSDSVFSIKVLRARG